MIPPGLDAVSKAGRYVMQNVAVTFQSCFQPYEITMSLGAPHLQRLSTNDGIIVLCRVD